MLGIDVSQETLACTLLDAPTRATLWEKSVPNTPTGVQQLLDLTPPDVSWVAEPTGRYSLAMVKQAREAGREVLMAPRARPRRICVAFRRGPRRIAWTVGVWVCMPSPCP